MREGLAQRTDTGKEEGESASRRVSEMTRRGEGERAEGGLTDRRRMGYDGRYGSESRFTRAGDYPARDKAQTGHHAGHAVDCARGRGSHGGDDKREACEIAAREI